MRDCVVIGIEKDGNAEACAVLLLEGVASNGDVAVKNANLSLAEFQRIRNWLVWPEPDFPRTPTQKPLLSRIREVATASISKAAAPRAPQTDSLQTLIAQVTGRAVNAASSDASLEAELQLTADGAELIAIGSDGEVRMTASVAT